MLMPFFRSSAAPAADSSYQPLLDLFFEHAPSSLKDAFPNAEKGHPGQAKPKQNVIDTGKARKTFGWEPKDAKDTVCVATSPSSPQCALDEPADADASAPVSRSQDRHGAVARRVQEAVGEGVELDRLKRDPAEKISSVLSASRELDEALV